MKSRPSSSRFKSEDERVELRQRNSTSIARGILDTAHEMGVDVIVLGLRQPSHGQVVMGTVVENVLAAALCDVIVYRAGHEKTFKRIVVPTDGSKDATVACEIGIRLAHHFDVKIEAMFVQDSYEPRWKGLGRIAQSLEGLAGRERVSRTLVTAHNPVEGILSRLSEDDLLIVGYSDRPQFERWLYGDFSRPLLDRAPSQVILTLRSSQQTALLDSTRRFVNRFRLRLTPVEQEDILRAVYDQSGVNLDYIVLIIIAAVLASLGLLLDNASVIIGAMLVAPVMQPCIAFAVGLSTARLNLVRRALIGLGVGIPLALLVAALISGVLPGHILTNELMSRTQPTLLDAAVAFASGVVGGYALARKDIPAALAGVAIAAALMPPLCAAGINIAGGRFELGLRAGLLFLMNITCIIISAWGVFLTIGMYPTLEKPTRRGRGLWILTVVVLVVVTVTILTSANTVANKVRIAQDQIQSIFGDSQVVSVEILPDNGMLDVRATIRTARTIRSGQVRSIEQQLIDRLGEPVKLEVAVLPVVTSQSGD